MLPLNHLNSQPPAHATPLAYSVPDTCRVAGIGKTKVYELLGAGQLRAVKIGAKTLILADSVRDYFASLPTLPAKSA